MNKSLIPSLIINIFIIGSAKPVFGQLVTISGRGMSIGNNAPQGADTIMVENDHNQGVALDSLDHHRQPPVSVNAEARGVVITPAELPQSLYLPVDGDLVITSPYGERYHPTLHKETFHSGVDIRAKYTGVRSVANGVVVRRGSDNRSGNYLVVRHQNGVESIYCHLSRFIRNIGDTVLAGCIIAISGCTGAATAPHLHFAMKINGKYVNPRPFLEALKDDKEQLYTVY